MTIHKGTELNNVNETWNENERRRERGEDGPGAPADAGDVDNELKQTIQEEAAEYDRVNKEERLLGGERATVRDDDASSGAE